MKKLKVDKFHRHIVTLSYKVLIYSILLRDDGVKLSSFYMTEKINNKKVAYIK